MKNILKIILITIISLFALIFIFLATIPLWFPFEKVKDFLVQELSEKINREVVIKEIKFNILKGIELNGFSIKEPKRYGGMDFIKDESIVLKYNLLALLGRELVIHKFEMISPYVEIIKEKDGRYNFSDIVEKFSSEKKDTSKISDKPQQQKKTKESPIKNIIITSVSIKNGRFIYADYSKTKVFSLKVEKFNFDMEDIILSGVKPVSIKMDCNVQYDKFNIPVSLKSLLTTDIKNKKVKFEINPFICGGINTTGKIDIINFKDISGTINSTANTKKILEVLPPDLTQKIQELNISIDINNDLNFSLINGIFSFNNILKMENGSLSYQNKKIIENLKSKLTMTSKYDYKGNFNFLLAGNEVKITSEGTSINNPKESVYYIDIYSPKFAIEYLLALFPKKEKKISGSQSTKDIKKQSKILTKKKKTEIKNMPGVYLTLRADSIFYKEVTIGKTISNIRFVDGKLYAETAINAYQGKINSNFVADINKETYSITADIASVEVNKLIDDSISVLPKKDPNKKTLLDDIKNKVYGKFSMESKFSGNTFKDIANTITGDGYFMAKDGKIATTDIGKDLSNKLGIKFLEQDIPYTIMYADFKMSNGKINIKNFKVYNGPNGENGDIRIKGAGYVTVDKEIDFKIESEISPNQAKILDEYFARNLSIKDISYAYNKDGWLPFDVRIYNTIENKKYDFSQPRMLDNIKRNLTKKIEEEGKRYLEEKGKEIIKNLFGK
ncbi:MAG: AsmA family protein [Candidatus Goldbacteria bacterium]|nr:AsmA family protein [Candidatus Goldiibacteriota bacterium]